jgi:hypothetical protein
MNSAFRNATLGASLIGLAMLATPALAGSTTTSTTVDPQTGASVTVQHHDAILPRNRSTQVTVDPGVGASTNVQGGADDNGTVVEHHESTTVEHD